MIMWIRIELKCWIRIRFKSIRIHNTDQKSVIFVGLTSKGYFFSGKGLRELGQKHLQNICIFADTKSEWMIAAQVIYLPYKIDFLLDIIPVVTNGTASTVPVPVY
jgi:hypothetical protein